jgi:hypothetical protein
VEIKVSARSAVNHGAVPTPNGLAAVRHKALSTHNCDETTMSHEFPVTLAWVFLASGLLAAVNTSRWKIILGAIVVVWAASFGSAHISLLAASTVEAYAWFAFLAVAVAFPTFVVAAIGFDVGAGLLNQFLSLGAEEAETPDTADAKDIS